MSAWQILAIEPTDDLKTLKKAYAVALKKAKPDEDPAGFQAVHTAYKQLSKQLKQQRKANKVGAQQSAPQEQGSAHSQSPIIFEAEEQAAEPERQPAIQTEVFQREEPFASGDESTEAVVVSPEVEPVSESPVVAPPEPVKIAIEQEEAPPLYQPQDAELPQVDVDELITQAEDALNLNDEAQTRAVFEHIFETSGLLGFGEGQQLSQRVFAVCLAQFAEHQGKAYCLQGQLAELLCYHFNWLTERQSLEPHFELLATDKMLSAFEKRIKEAEQDNKYSAMEQRWQKRLQKKVQQEEVAAQRRASVFTRFFAFAIDITLVVLTCILLDTALDLVNLHFGLGYSLTATLGYFIYCEIQWAQTFGKRWLKMKVVNTDGEPPSALLVLWRTVALFISLGLLKLFFLHMFFWFKGRALHDPISRTEVWKITAK